MVDLTHLKQGPGVTAGRVWQMTDRTWKQSLLLRGEGGYHLQGDWKAGSTVTKETSGWGGGKHRGSYRLSPIIKRMSVKQRLVKQGMDRKMTTAIANGLTIHPPFSNGKTR